MDEYIDIRRTKWTKKMKAKEIKYAIKLIKLIKNNIVNNKPSLESIVEEISKIKLDILRDLQMDKDPKYLGIPNICFSLTDSNDSREKQFRKQRIKRGFDDSETWSLFNTITDFILPRLKYFRDITPGIPASINGEDEWIDILNKMIFSFEYVKNYDHVDIEENNKNEASYEEGMKLFIEYFFALWW